MTRGGQFRVAALLCTEWSWTENAETHTACTTPDGVLLRLTIAGETVAQARSVLYEKQRPELFAVPSGYQPALAPEGGNEP